MHYLVFNKPYGVLTQFTDRSVPPRPTLKDYIPVKGIYPVGRLDSDSEGLLLLTDDGELQNRLSDPRYAHPRTYWVQVERVPTEDTLARLRTGLTLGDFVTRPAGVRLLDPPPDVPDRDPPIRYRKSVPDCWIEMILTEGKNRQVRRMTAAVGHPTLRLIRVAIGVVGLQGLAPGKWRVLDKTEIVLLGKVTG